MSSLWDGFAQKIYSGKIDIEEVVELIEFLKEFDKVNNNVISNLMHNQLKHANLDFTDWDVFEVYIKTGSVHKRVLEYFIGALHDFDHENEQVIMYSFERNKHYWRNHTMYRNQMGTFKDGKWKYSKLFTEIRNERGIK